MYFYLLLTHKIRLFANKISNMKLRAADKIIIFSRYIGQQVIINSLVNNEADVIGTIQGIRDNALLIDADGFKRWIPLSDEITLCDIKLLLKPLKKLTAPIIDTANNL